MHANIIPWVGFAWKYLVFECLLWIFCNKDSLSLNLSKPSYPLWSKPECKYNPFPGHLAVHLQSLLLFTSPSPPLPSASIAGNSVMSDWVWLCVRTSCLVEVWTGCLHPNRNLILRCMKLFLNSRLYATCFGNIYELWCSPSSCIEQQET